MFPSVAVQEMNMPLYACKHSDRGRVFFSHPPHHKIFNSKPSCHSSNKTNLYGRRRRQTNDVTAAFPDSRRRAPLIQIAAKQTITASNKWATNFLPIHLASSRGFVDWSPTEGGGDVIDSRHWRRWTTAEEPLAKHAAPSANAAQKGSTYERLGSGALIDIASLWHFDVEMKPSSLGFVLYLSLTRDASR